MTKTHHQTHHQQLNATIKANYYSKQCRTLYQQQKLTNQEVLNYAALRNKIPTLEALISILEYARHPEMCVDLQEEIIIQSTINATVYVAKLVDKQLNDYNDALNDKYEHAKNEFLVNLKIMLVNTPNYCNYAFLKKHVPNHDPFTCTNCLSVAQSEALLPEFRDPTLRRTKADFLYDYYDRSQVVLMISKLRKCKCCYEHQIQQAYVQDVYPHVSTKSLFQYHSNDYTVDFFVPEHEEINTVFDNATTQEEREMLLNPSDGDIIPCIEIYPLTKAQAKLPKCYHTKCNCQCVNSLQYLTTIHNQKHLVE